MALVVEDGGGLPNANSWASHENAKAYITSIGGEWPDDQDEGEKLLLKAMAEILPKYSGKWRGWIYRIGQSLPWPRVDFFDDEGRYYVQGYPGMPPEVAILQITVAYAYVQDPERGIPQRRGINIVSEKIGPITDVFQYDPKYNPELSNPAIARVARPLIEGSKGRVEIHRS